MDLISSVLLICNYVLKILLIRFLAIVIGGNLFENVNIITKYTYKVIPKKDPLNTQGQ